MHATSRPEWRAWLIDRHEHERGVWLCSWKAATGRPACPYPDAVEEAICFGWIDSTVNVLDEERALQLFTPLGDHWGGNRLVVSLQPEDRLQLHLLAKVPGQRERLQPVALNLDFSDAWRIPVRDAYERHRVNGHPRRRS